MESAPRINESHKTEGTESAPIMENMHEQNEKRAQINVREMFNAQMEARGTIRDVIAHGVEHYSERF